MRSEVNVRAIRWLLAAGLAFGAAAAQAASGVTITQSQEATVGVGMSTSQVEQILGRPADVITYGRAPGPTWTYAVGGGSPFGVTEFDVDFGSDGRVTSVGERVLGHSG